MVATKMTLGADRRGAENDERITKLTQALLRGFRLGQFAVFTARCESR